MTTVDCPGTLPALTFTPAGTCTTLTLGLLPEEEEEDEDEDVFVGGGTVAAEGWNPALARMDPLPRASSMAFTRRDQLPLSWAEANACWSLVGLAPCSTAFRPSFSRS